MGLTLVINFIANIILIPRIGIPGAGVAAVMTFIALFWSGFYFVRKEIPVTIGEWWKNVGAVTFAGIVMMVGVLLVKHAIAGLHPYAWVLAIPFGALLFGCAAYLTGGITKEHFRSATALLRRKKYAEGSPANN